MKSGPWQLTVFIPVVLLLSCSDKQKKEKFFPVLSFIQSQVAHVDTSLYSIQKIVFNDSVGNDTTYIRREEFSKEAIDFLTIPDLALPKYSERYTESKLFEETLKRPLLLYLPVNPEKEEIQRQEVLIKTDPSGDKVTNIIINSIVTTKDSSILKRMLWNVDKSFQVITTKQLAGQDEEITTYKVTWNEDEQE